MKVLEPSALDQRLRTVVSPRNSTLTTGVLRLHYSGADVLNWPAVEVTHQSRKLHGSGQVRGKMVTLATKCGAEKLLLIVRNLSQWVRDFDQQGRGSTFVRRWKLKKLEVL